MKREKAHLLTALAAIAVIASGFQTTPDHKILFEKAKFAMETKGDLQSAIKLFQEIIAKYPQEKEYAARAQFYIGTCYEKLGNTEAIKAYELVLKKYADQPELVVAARERLSALRREKPSAGEIDALLPAEGDSDAQSLSPDGTKVAIVDYSAGQNIAVYDLATKHTDLITHYDWSGKDSGWTASPHWSPDGKELAYVFATWYAVPTISELRIVSLDGRSRTLYRVEGEDNAAPLGWLRDGSAVIAQVTVGKITTLGLLSPSDGTFKPLRVIKASSADSSPDGRWIVFEDVREGKSHDIFIISRDGKNVETLTDHPSEDKIPRWSPDGKYIIFLSQRHGDWALWGVAVSEGKPTGDPFMIRTGMQDESLLNWTASGLGIQSAVKMDDVYILPVNPATGEPAGKARLVSYPVTGINTGPVWSPDGKFLAFASIAMNKPDRRHIVVMLAGGGDHKEFLIPSKIPSFQPHSLCLRWLPDSSGLGFSNMDDNKTWVAFRLDLKTGGWKTWPLPDTWPHSEWSGSNTYVYCKYGQYGEESSIVERQLDTGTERVIYRSGKPGSGQVVFRGLKFARDQRWLGFQERRGDDDSKIVVVDVQSGNSRVFSSDFLGGPTWSPDGNFVLALSSPAWDKNFNAINVFSLQDGKLSRYPIADLFPKNASVFHPDWSADGKELAFRVSYTRSELLRMKNVIAEKR